jgi:hypothetical protein
MLAERLSGMDVAAFSGSYSAEDVTFLLKPVRLAPTPVADKEALIQSGRRHYSEMIPEELPPEPEYLRLFEEALARNGARLAGDISNLAAHLMERAQGREVVMASLARAGTPIGVLLLRALRARNYPVAHYSISIIRDRGIDLNALAYIAARHDPADVVFVDGWTGKGAIAGELRRSLRARPLGFSPILAVVADPAGKANIAATTDDYLIASGLLGGIVSGLVSRSVLSTDTVGPGDFHACVVYSHLQRHDISRRFVDTVAALAIAAEPKPIGRHADRRRALAAGCEATISQLLEITGATDRNRIKPGIAEATRAFLRRVPDRLFLRDPDDPDVAHLLLLAKQAGLPIERLSGGSAYRAVAIIRELGAGPS